MAYLHELEWLDTGSGTPFKMLSLCQKAGHRAWSVPIPDHPLLGSPPEKTVQFFIMSSELIDDVGTAAQGT